MSIIDKSDQLGLFEFKTSIYLQQEELDKDYFDLFTWAIPTAFSTPLSQCYFESGDMLYNTKKAYLSPWSKALEHVKHMIQVTFPQRTFTYKSDIIAPSIFEKNWKTPVEFDFYNFENAAIKDKKHIITSQGALYTFLWKGDYDLLLSKDNISIPFRGNFLKKSFSYEIKKQLQRSLENNYDFKEAFIMPYDKTNPLLKSKYKDILNKLNRSAKTFKVLYARFANYNEIEICPTMHLVCFLLNEFSSDSVLHDIIRNSVYKTLKESNEDKFKIGKHGFYFTKVNNVGT